MAYPFYNEHTGHPAVDNKARLVNRWIRLCANDLYTTFSSNDKSRKEKKAYKKAVMPGYLSVYREVYEGLAQRYQYLEEALGGRDNDS